MESAKSRVWVGAKDIDNLILAFIFLTKDINHFSISKKGKTNL